jgi:hypothetical protein
VRVDFQKFVLNMASVASVFLSVCEHARLLSNTHDMMVLICIALLCTDENGDGFISLSEMRKYLSSVFRVMYTMNPAFEASNGVDANTLAAVTADKVCA